MAKILTHEVDGNKVTAEAALRLEQLGFYAKPIEHEIYLETSDYEQATLATWEQEGKTAPEVNQVDKINE